MPKKISLRLLIFFALAGWVFGFQYELAKPSYDSGWLAFAQNEIKILTHNLGGNINDYVVDMQFRDDWGKEINQAFFGCRDLDTVGATWDKLTTSSIRIYRGSSDVKCEEIRVRIWKIERANFDSGWLNIAQGQTLNLAHNIGGSSDDYVVYLEFKDNESYGIHQRSYGGSHYNPVSIGAYWSNLSSSTIGVFRSPDDLGADQIRVRIWKANHPDYDSGWQAAGIETAFNHNLGGPWNDYVVDLQFKDIEVYGVNHRFYGGGLSAYDQGAYWKGLNGSQVYAYRQNSAPHIDQVRVRIWKCSAPKYDSGWFNLSPGASQTLTHNLGGNADDYVVDLQFKDSVFSINNRYYGGRKCYDALSVYTRYRGAYWYALNNSQITVYRSGDDAMADQVRVRLWLAPSADMDSGWQTISAGGYKIFNPWLNNADDCVVYLEFKNSSGGVHHTDYGGDKWWNNSDVLYLYGAYWDNLSPTNIKINRQQNDTLVEQFRVRIWRNDPTPVPRYAWKDDWISYEPVVPTVRTHGLGGDVNDYVLDMRFQASALFFKNHRFYGSIYGKYEKSGAYYQNLNSSSLEVVRELNDGNASQIMLRLWTTGYTPKTVFVSGHISYAGNPLPDVAVNFSGTGGGTCYTDSNGNYFMSLPYNYSGTATPTRTGYAFTPTHGDYSSLVANTMTDYTADAVPSITVTSPTAASDWKTGTAYDITWTTTGAVGNVKVELLQGGVFNSTIAGSTVNDALLSWTPGYSLATASNYQVKISDVSNASINNTSPNFTITKTALTVTQPNGGEQWLLGSVHNITWTSTEEVGNVKIEYSTNAGSSFAQIIASTPNDGTHPWMIPDVVSSNCLVRVSDASNAAVNDVSNGVFSIVSILSASKDFNGDGQDDVLWRYYGSEGSNVVWYLGDSGGAVARLEGSFMDRPMGDYRSVDMLQGQGPEHTFADPREPGMMVSEKPAQRVFGDPREAGGLMTREDTQTQRGVPTTRDPGEIGGAGLNGVPVMRVTGATWIGNGWLPAVTDTNWEIVGTGDFNADGNVDILWRDYSLGYNVIWYMEGVTWIGNEWLPAVTDTNWKIEAIGDFDGDGKVDILWRDYSLGYNVIWYMEGVTWVGNGWLPAVTDTNWKIAGTGDFNGDGKVDILWRYYGAGGSNLVWYMDGAMWAGNEWLPAVTDTNWKIEGTGDFDGDGKVDILWRDYSLGYNVIWYMDGAMWAGNEWLPAVTDINWRIENH
jgi:hypothetical protein